MIHKVPVRDIYKYRNFQWGYEIIEKNELYFNDPREFEDVNDASINLVDFTASNEDIISIINENGSNRKEKRENIKIYLNDKKKFSDLSRLAYSEKLDNIRISCFSRSPFINQQWLKYADCYKGMCLHFNSRFEVQPIFPYTVSYCEPLPKYNFFQEKEHIYIKAITTKLRSKYSFEKEIRLFHDGRIKIISFDSSLLLAVILGSEMSSDSVNKVRRQLEKTHLKHVVLKRATCVDEKNVKIEDI